MLFSSRGTENVIYILKNACLLVSEYVNLTAEADPVQKKHKHKSSEHIKHNSDNNNNNDSSNDNNSSSNNINYDDIDSILSKNRSNEHKQSVQKALEDDEELHSFYEDYPKLELYHKNDPIRTNGIQCTENAVFFYFDKSFSDRDSPFKGSTHRNNNLYLIFYKDDDTLYPKCRDTQCAGQSLLVFTNEDSEHESDDQLDHFTDDSLARVFYQHFGDAWMWTPAHDEGSSGFMFHNGLFWMTDNEDTTKLQHFLANHFQDAVAAGLEHQLQSGLIDDKQFKKQRNSLRTKLQHESSVNSRKRSLMRTLKNYVKNTNELDTDKFDMVFSNCVYNVKSDTFRN